MIRPAKTSTIILGCDVGKDEIAIFNSSSGRHRTVANCPRALKAFADNLPDGVFAVCEATGGYEKPLLAALTRAGVNVHRADARKVKAFIRSLGRLAKTDAIDAEGLARYGQERQGVLALWAPAPAHLETLQTLVRLRTQLVKEHTAWRNQASAPGAAPVKAHLTAMIKACETRLEAVEADIDRLIQDHEDLKTRVEIIQQIKGCGPTTARALTALMPELGSLGRKRAASLAGLAPHPHQSGKRDGYRRTRGGRPEVKRALFMAAMAATRYNEDLKAFYLRLVNGGKKKLVAITAVMRKLITIINARIRDANRQTKLS